MSKRPLPPVVDIIIFAKKLKAECDSYGIFCSFITYSGHYISINKLHTLPKVYLNKGKFSIDTSRANEDLLDKNMHGSSCHRKFQLNVPVYSIKMIVNVEEWIFTKILEGCFMPESQPDPEW